MKRIIKNAEIERLEAELTRLKAELESAREALRKVLAVNHVDCEDLSLDEIQDIARRALSLPADATTATLRMNVDRLTESIHRCRQAAEHMVKETYRALNWEIIDGTVHGQLASPAFDWAERERLSGLMDRIQAALDRERELQRKLEFAEAELQHGKSYLRHLCKHFGDTDWPETEDLYNIVVKHLGDHLFAKKGD